MKESEAAVAIVHARGEPESVLLMRRASRRGDSWSGHWAFPGGRRDPEDPDLLATALRELEEECGVRLRREDREAEMPARLARRRVRAYVPVTPFLFHTPRELDAAPDSREAVETVWLPLSVLRDPERHRLMAVPGRPPSWLFPAVALNGTPLWGFTYRLICDWLSLGPAREFHRQAGHDAANQVLQFLLSRGMTLKNDWTRRSLARGREATVAEVSGAMPARELLEQFSTAGSHVFGVNCLEVRPDRVRIAGLLFEDYLIRTSA